MRLEVAVVDDRKGVRTYEHLRGEWLITGDEKVTTGEYVDFGEGVIGHVAHITRGIQERQSTINVVARVHDSVSAATTLKELGFEEVT